MKCKTLTFGILLAFTSVIKAQQLPQYSTWLANSYLYNPAAAGLENTLVANGIYRKQWIDLDGAPVSQHINASVPLYIINSGVGLRVDNDAIGAHRTTQVILNYDYQLELGTNGLLSLGGGLGYQQYSLDGSRLRAPQGDYTDPAFQHNDAFLSEGNVSAGAPVFELGVWVAAGRFSAGLSSLPVFAPQLKLGNDGSARLSPRQHFVFQTAWQWENGESLVIKPGLLIKTDLTATQMEIGALATWKEKLTAGFSWRGFTPSTHDAAVIIAGLKINENTDLLYAYDLPLSALQTVNRGSHELSLRYSLGQPVGTGKLPPVIYNPRFQ